MNQVTTTSLTPVTIYGEIPKGRVWIDHYTYEEKIEIGIMDSETYEYFRKEQEEKYAAWIKEEFRMVDKQLKIQREEKRKKNREELEKGKERARLFKEQQRKNNLKR